jgi:hypothetical protein
MTKQISSPLSLAAFTSAAISATNSGSMPKGWLPINTSPESFNKTRLYWG